jgi:hypothetical protein
MAQQLATLEGMFPERAFLGIGSGETMNEVVAALQWPRWRVDAGEPTKMLEKLGATTIVLMNMSGNDPHGTLKVYGQQVLPKLRNEGRRTGGHGARR